MVAVAQRGLLNGVLTVSVTLDEGQYRWTNEGHGPQIKSFGGSSEGHYKKSDEWLAKLEENAGLEPGGLTIEEVEFAQTLGYANYTDEELDAELDKLAEERQNESTKSQSGSDSDESRSEENKTPIEEVTESGEPQDGGELEEGSSRNSVGGGFRLSSGPDFIDNTISITALNDTPESSILQLIINGKVVEDSCEIDPGAERTILNEIKTGDTYVLTYKLTRDDEETQPSILLEGAVTEFCMIVTESDGTDEEE